MRKPLFHADWLSAVFLHFAVDADWLQPQIPLELDRFDGRAFVSLVAFTQARLRPIRSGRFVEWLSAPLARHEFLNLRTYVRHGDTRGILFLAEWIPNRLAVLIGPRMYGLPYRLGKLEYSNDLRFRELRGHATSFRRSLSYRATLLSRDFKHATSSLDHFLVERYTAFTSRDRTIRRFDVAHEPWPIVRLDARITESTLLPWPIQQPTLAHFSPGVFDVAITAPSLVSADTLAPPAPSTPPPASHRSTPARARRNH